MFVQLQDVSFCHADREVVLASARAELGRGWTAVAGANGAGKTTLLRLIAGELQPGSGRIVIRPQGARIHVVAQGVDSASPVAMAFLEANDGAAARIKSELGVGAWRAQRWLTLSPGERRRVQIGAALWDEPDILICDEPDAHLDPARRDRAVAMLHAHRGIGILASHRRDIIDALCTTTLWLDRGRLDAYDGGYTSARALRDAARRSMEERREELSRAAARIGSARDDVRRRREGAEHSDSAGRRMKSHRDHDGSSSARKFRAERALATLSRLEGTLETRHQRAQRDLAGARVERILGRDVRFAARPCPDGRVGVFTERELRAGDGAGPIVLGRTSVVVSRTTRARIAGPNGAGKTTLLEALHRRARRDAALYLPQLIDEAARLAIARDLRAASSVERGRWLSIVAALGSEPERVLASPCPSPGEARKLTLARALLVEVSALFLDEPTNDLDLPSIERIESALAAYEGAVIVVTHDDAFARATTTELWTIDDHVLHNDAGNFQRGSPAAGSGDLQVHRGRAIYLP